MAALTQSKFPSLDKLHTSPSRTEKTGRGGWKLIPYAILLVCCLGWIGVFATHAPMFGGIDSFIFRDAGCNVAAGLGLTSQSTPTEPVQVPPRLFAAYTPGVPLLFAPAARLFGCGLYTDTFYNLGVLTLLAAFALTLLPGTRKAWAGLLLGLTLPGGLFFTDLDRPEPLAIVLFFGLLLLWRRTSRPWQRALVTSGSGLLFLMHPYIGIVSFPLFLLLAAGAERRVPWRTAMGGAVVGAAFVLLWVGLMRAADPEAMSRFLAHAAGAKSGAGIVLRGGAHGGFLYNYALALGKGVNPAQPLGVAPLAALVAIYWLLMRRIRTAEPGARASLYKTLAVLAVLTLLFPLAAFPSQPRYLAASSAMVFGVLAVGGWRFSDALGRGRAPYFVLLAVALCSAPAILVQLLKVFESAGTYRHEAAQVARVRSGFRAAGVENPRVLIDSDHLLLFKRAIPRLYDSGYFMEGDSVAPFDGLIRCYEAQKAMRRKDLKWEPPFRSEDWTLLESNDEPQAITVLGHRLQRRNWSWACDVYARKR